MKRYLWWGPERFWAEDEMPVEVGVHHLPSMWTHYCSPIQTKIHQFSSLNPIDYRCLFFWEGNGTPLQYSCLENPMDGGTWWATVHGVATSWTRLSDFTFPFDFHVLEKEMATHSIVLAWRIPGTGEPGGPPSTGSHRVGHDWRDLAATAGMEMLVCSLT